MNNVKSKKTGKLIFKIVLALIVGTLLGRGLVLSDAGIAILRLLITFSDLISQFLSFFVPIVVFGLVMPGIIELGNQANKMLISALLLSYFSMLIIGFVCVLLGYSFVPAIFDSIMVGGKMLSIVEYKGFLPKLLTPFFDVVGAIVLAFTFGLAAAKTKTDIFTKLAREVENCIYNILNKFLIPILPFYIGCIFTKLSATGELMANFSNFAIMVLAIFVVSNAYTLLMMLLASKLTKKSFFIMLKAYLPAYLVAFGTQSSKATIPISLVSAEKMGVSKEVSEFAVPLLATTHMLGSMVTQIFGSIAIYYVFTGSMIPYPLMLSYITILATMLLAAPGIPGGEAVATKPMLVSYLGFPVGVSETMFAFGVANDSFATSINVTGDSAIILILDALHKKWFRNNKNTSTVS